MAEGKTGDVRVELDYTGLGEVMRGAGVAAMLDRAGRAVKDAADARHILVERGQERHPVPIEVDTHRAGNRARTQVWISHPAGLNIEAKYSLLTSSIDAAGGGT